MKTVLMAFVMLFSAQAMAGYSQNSSDAVQFLEQFLKGLSINDSVQAEVSDNQRVLVGNVKGSDKACSLMIQLTSVKTLEKMTFTLDADGTQNSSEIYYKNSKHMSKTAAGLVERDLNVVVDDNLVSITDEKLTALSLFDGGEVVELHKDVDGLIYEASYMNTDRRWTCSF